MRYNGKYLPLKNHFKYLTKDIEELSFDEIEKILKFQLPPYAREHKSRFWSNNVSYNPHAKSWLDAGWQFNKINSKEDKIVFIKSNNTIFPIIKKIRNGNKKDIMENKEKIIELANLAHKILEPENDETPYLKNKKIISEIFSQTKEWINKEEVRLTLIDSLYSTKMAMRMYGIYDVSLALRKDFPINESDKILSEKAISFIENVNDLNKDDFISSLFLGGYGMHKVDTDSHDSAPSLISKYLYFLTNYKFPIYDSLAKESMSKLFGSKKNSDFISCFSNLKKINNDYSINNFDRLDNLLWLWGKIEKGSYSLILKREKYTELINAIKPKGKKSNEVDKELKMRENEIHSVINNNYLSEFIEIKNELKIIIEPE